MLKNTLLGVGTTLIAISLLMFFITDQGEEELKFSEEIIIKKAQELGMEFPKVEQTNPEENEEATKSNKIDVKKENNKSQEELKRELKAELKTELKQELLPKEKKILIEIPQGISSSEIATLLVHKGLIDNKNSFILLLDELEVDRKIRAGTYSFKTPISPIQVLLELTTDNKK